MSKSYYFLIAILVITVLTIGSLAFYKTAYQPAQKPSPTPVSPTAKPAQPERQNMIPLVVDFPKDGTQVNTATITASGTTVPNADVTVNDSDTTADEKGKFKVNLALEEGDNPITITAADDSGNDASWESIITYTPQQ